MKKHLLIVVTAVVAASLHSRASGEAAMELRSRGSTEAHSFVSGTNADVVVSESSGSIQYRHDISIPSGRGVTPSLALVYSSSAHYSEVGWGWELTIPTIERDPQDGVVTYTSADRFRYRDGHSSVRLVRTGVMTIDGWEEYREEIEQSFSRYLYKANQWRITTTGGRLLQLGTDASRRRGKSVATLDGTAAWLVYRISDPHTNYADFAYSPDPAGNARLDAIHYNGNSSMSLAPTMHVELTWVAHWTPSLGLPTDYRSGYRRVFGRQRLDRIRVNVAAHDTSGSPAKLPTSTPVERVTTFDYGSPVPETENRMFYLRSIRQDALAPVAFTYTDPLGPAAPFGFQDPISGTEMPDFASITKVDKNSTSATTTLADMNGDGRLDLVQADWNCHDHLWRIWFNTGPEWTEVDWHVDPEGAPDPCATRYTEILADGSGVLQDLVDVTGDSIPDLIFRDNSDELVVCAGGQGPSLDSCVRWFDEYGYLRRTESPFLSVQATTSDLLDFNGDGLVDRVVISSTGSSTAYVYFGTGGGWEPPRKYDLPPCGVLGLIQGCVRLTEDVVGPPPSDPEHFNTRVLADTIDVNGDGLPDFLTTHEATGDIMVAWHGTDGYGALESMVNGPSIIGFGTKGAADFVAERELLDMNADGLPDAVWLNCAGEPQLYVRYNLGGSWETEWRPQGFGQGIEVSGYDSLCINRTAEVYTADDTRVGVRSLLTDISGDGIPDFFLAPTSGIPTITQFMVLRNHYIAPRKLREISSLNGHAFVRISYEPHLGFVPFALHVPAAVTRSRAELWVGEPSSSTSGSTQYTYIDASYDRLRRRFTGFAQVVADDVDRGASRTTNYGSSYFDSGIVLTTAVANVNPESESAPHSQVNTYTEVYLGSGRRVQRLDRTEDFDGFLGRIRRTEYTGYNLDSGQLTSWIEAGWADTPNDDVRHQRTLVVRNDSSARLVLPSTETLFGAEGSVLRRARWYYDVKTHGLPPVNGDLVRFEEEQLNGTWVPHLRVKYDNLGRVLELQDALGSVTSYSYDATHGRFSTRIVDPIGTTHQSYHALTGTVSDTCGPQHSGTSWNCSRTEVDRYGRITATWLPRLGVTGSYSRVKASATTYDDNAYPLKICTRTRPDGPNWGLGCEYKNGFGQVIQQRVMTDGETFRVANTELDPRGAPLRSWAPTESSGSAYTAPASGSAQWTYTFDYVRSGIESVRNPVTSGGGMAIATRKAVAAPGLATAIERVDEDGNATLELLDGFNEVQSITRDGGSGPDSVTTYGRDQLGQLVSVTDGNGLMTTFDRDRFGAVIARTDPDGGVTTYTYNDRGQLVAIKDARDVDVNFELDGAGRTIHVISHNEPAGVRHVDETLEYYDATTPTLIGLLRSESAESITNLYDYDAEGNLRAQQSFQGPHSGAVKFEWDTGGRLEQVRYNEELVVDYHYNRDDSLARVDSPGLGVLGRYAYEDDGQVGLFDNDFRVDISYSYDARRRLVGVLSTTPSAVVVDDTIGLTQASRIGRLVRQGDYPGAGPRPTAEVQVVTRDSLGRVTRVERDGNTVGAYGYDAGDRLHSYNDGVLQGPSTSIYAHDRLVSRVVGSSSFSYAYDAAGNVLRDERTVSGDTRVRHHGWDALNRYTSTTVEDGPSTTYYYTPSGAVARVTSPGAEPSLRDELHVGELARKDMASDSWRYRVLGGDGVIAEYEAGALEFLHRTLGNTVAGITDVDGNVVRQQEFTAYGAPVPAPDGTDASRAEGRFQGLRTDELVIAGTRVYDPERGSWLSRDLIRELGPEELIADARLVALYAFNYGDPATFVDPSGLAPEGGPTIGIPTGIGDGSTGTGSSGRTTDEWGEPIQVMNLPPEVRNSPLLPENLANNVAWQTGQVVIAAGDATFEGATWVFPQLEILRYAYRGEWDMVAFSTAISVLPLGKIIANGAKRLSRYMMKTGPVSRILGMSEKSLSHAFQKHAAQWGMVGNWNKNNRYLFSQLLNQFVNRTDILVKKGVWRGNVRAVFYLDRATRLLVVTDRSGMLLAAHRISPWKAWLVRVKGRL